MRRVKCLSGSTVLVIIVVLLGCVSIRAQQTESSPSERGRSEAAHDVQNEKFVIKAWGLPEFKINDIPSRTEVYESLLLTRYKISLEWVAGCVIDEETLSYALAYNQVSRAGIAAKFGKDILEKVRKEADKEYESKGYAEKARQFEQKFRDNIQTFPKKDN